MLSRVIIEAPLEAALARLARDEIDLDRRAERQRRHRHRGARGIRRLEVACIHRIHRGEILHVGEIHVHACDIGERFADRSEQRAQILQHLLGLRAHIAIDEPAGNWTQGYLSADEQERAHTHAGRKGIFRIDSTGTAELAISGAGLIGLAFTTGPAAILVGSQSVYHLNWGIRGKALLE